MGRRKLKMSKKHIAARRAYKRKRAKKAGGAIVGAAAFGPWGWLLPF